MLDPPNAAGVSGHLKSLKLRATPKSDHSPMLSRWPVTVSPSSQTSHPTALISLSPCNSPQHHNNTSSILTPSRSKHLPLRHKPPQNHGPLSANSTNRDSH